MQKLPLTIAAALVVSSAAFIPPALADGSNPPPCVARANAFLGGVNPDGISIHIPFDGTFTFYSQDLAHLNAAAHQGDGFAQFLEGLCDLLAPAPGQPD
jgi:hypothetical protein